MIHICMALLCAALVLVSFIFGRKSVTATGVVNLELSAPQESVKKGGGWRRTLYWTTGLAIAFSIPLFVMSPAEAALSDTMRSAFNGALANFVNGIMNDTGNDVYAWSWMMFLALSFFLMAIEVIKFIFDGFNAASHLEALIYFFTTLAIMGGYNAFTEAIWGIGLGISNGYQEYLVGNTDNFFLAQWVNKATSAVVADDLDLFDSIKLIMYSFQWTITCTLLDLVFWLASMWAEFGYALAKVTGMIFIPFLLLPATRPLFDGWFKFFLGFVILLIILKATMVVCAITIQSVLNGLGVTFAGDFGEPQQLVQVAKENMYLLVDASAMMIVAVLFILSSFVFAGMIAGGGGSLSGGLGKATNMIIRRALK